MGNRNSKVKPKKDEGRLANKEASPKNNDVGRIELRRQILETFEGPTPHPEIVERYEALQAGSWDRILTMAEKAQDHAQRMEDKALDANIHIAKSETRLSYFGLALAFLLAAGGIFGGVYMLLEGFTWQSVAPFIAGIVPLVGSFILEKRYRQPSNNKK